MVSQGIGRKWRGRISARRGAVCSLGIVSALSVWLIAGTNAHSQTQQDSLIRQTQAEVDRKNTGCVSCHVRTDEPTMHPTQTVRLACTDCHGGDSNASVPAGTAQNSPVYEETKKRAHPQPHQA